MQPDAIETPLECASGCTIGEELPFLIFKDCPFEVLSERHTNLMSLCLQLKTAFSRQGLNATYSCLSLASLLPRREIVLHYHVHQTMRKPLVRSVLRRHAGTSHTYPSTGISCPVT